MPTPSTIQTPETDDVFCDCFGCEISDYTPNQKRALEVSRSLELRLSIALAALENLDDMLELGPVLWQASKRHEHAQKLIENTLDEIKSLAK